MKYKLLVCTVLSLIGVSSLRADALTALAERISPELKSRVNFVVNPQETTITVAPAPENKIQITAPDTRLAAAGLGCYLRQVAEAH